MIVVRWQVYKREYFDIAGEIRHKDRLAHICEDSFTTMEACIASFESYKKDVGVPEDHAVRFVVRDVSDKDREEGQLDLEDDHAKFRWRCYRMDGFMPGCLYLRPVGQRMIKESEEVFPTYAECRANFDKRYGKRQMGRDRLTFVYVEPQLDDGRYEGGLRADGCKVRECMVY